MCRKEVGRLPKNIFYGQLPSAPRPVGRSKLRYKDALNGTQHTVNTENWEHFTGAGSVFPGAPFYETDEHMPSKRISQTAIVAELIVGHDGKGHREIERDCLVQISPKALNHFIKSMGLIYAFSPRNMVRVFENASIFTKEN